MSRSNPYYIVEQGKISQLMKQSKAARLALFQDIAGTKVYDDRKRESQKIMKDTDSKREHIEEVISTLEERLRELEAESKELKRYQVRGHKREGIGTKGRAPSSWSHRCVVLRLCVVQELDTTRRSLEYSIYEHEQKIAVQKLEEIDQKRGRTRNKPAHARRPFVLPLLIRCAPSLFVVDCV